MPQIELMSADLPHTLYKDRNDSKMRKSDIEEAERLMLEAQEKKKRRQEERQYTVKELFEGIDELEN